MAGARSIVEYFGDHERYRCGYCGSSDTNYSRGMWAHTMTVQDYEDLIDRGWRRSGKYCYKPSNKVTCCPHYTIKQDAPNFKMSKSHKKVIKRVNKFLIHGIGKGEKTSEAKEGHSDDAVSGEHLERLENIVPSDLTLPQSADSGPSSKSGDQSKGNNPSHHTRDPSPSASRVDSKKENMETESRRSYPKPGAGADPNKPVCRKAKDIRKERKLQKLAEKGVDVETIDNKKKAESNEKSLEDFLSEPEKAENAAHKLEPMSRSRGPGYGSYHQHYLLDGKLIMVGVIDILPHCMSSVYLYYDPEYSFLSLGTYSALREIAFVRELHRQIPELHYYYMGYYIHSCPKMRYKGQYYPSYIVCPEAFTWVPMEKCVPKLDASRYSRLEEEGVEDENSKIDLDRVLVLHDSEAMPYEVYRFLCPKATDEEEVKEYATLAGKKCAERMLLFRK